MYDDGGMIEWSLGLPFDKLEDRYGRVVALLVSFSAGLLIIAALIGVLAYIL